MTGDVLATAVACANTRGALIIDGVGVAIVAGRIVRLRWGRADTRQMITDARFMTLVDRLASHALAEIFTGALSMCVALVIHGVAVRVITLRARCRKGVAARSGSWVARAGFVARPLRVAGDALAPAMTGADARCALVINGVGISIVTWRIVGLLRVGTSTCQVVTDANIVAVCNSLACHVCAQVDALAYAGAAYVLDCFVVLVITYSAGALHLVGAEAGHVVTFALLVTHVRRWARHTSTKILSCTPTIGADIADRMHVAVVATGAIAFGWI